ncbi:type III-B CRISPR module RAMP protein Cmr4 [Numidum massiliense]|uniref:type III-B CRISPR module RAMP protein Cmr4 n=1 Tax=Numidum massiliense TaxID=1522315 RepID=UPI0006D5536A|nr:type III-B CRISPR module RAMP protein Cmr4 [Numidum massiliense]
MYTKAKPFLLHAITSVHAGSGSEIGIVDLPIQREKHTGYPKVESSSLKGAIRFQTEGSCTSEQEKKKFELVFGAKPRTENDTGDTSNANETQASAIAFSDARILLFPVRSLRGVFTWITCPHVLKRFNDERKVYANGNVVEELVVPDVSSDASVYPVSSDHILVGNDKLILEEYTFHATVDEEAQILARQISQMLGDHLSIDVAQRIAVLSDSDFSDFVKLSTEVNARIKVGDNGTVDSGALWYEENVPPEAVFYSFLFIGNVRGKGIDGMQTAADVAQFMVEDENFPAVFQLGGNYTIGKGMMRRIWLAEDGQ